MDELLQKLLEAEVLTEDTRDELKTAFQAKLDEAMAAAEKDAVADVTARLTEEWVTERDQLVEAVDGKVTEFLESELSEMKTDIESFRDLEAEHATKLVEAKAAMADELKGDLGELVEKVDAFLEIRLAAEFSELREDLETVKKNDMGRRIFEAFQTEFVANFADEDSAQATLRETEKRLADAEAQLEEAEKQTGELTRTMKLESVLAPLAGKQKEIMEAILRNVSTEQLEEGYSTFIGRVIREADDSEKEGTVLRESDESDEDDEKEDKKSKKKAKAKKSDDDDEDDADDEDEDLKEGRQITGDTEEGVVITESEEIDPAHAARIARLQRIAGIK